MSSEVELGKDTEMETGIYHHMYSNVEQNQQTTGLLPTPSLDGATLDLQVEDGNGLELAKRTLVGKVLTEKPINKSVLKSIILKAWNYSSGVQMTDMGINCLLFTFEEESMAIRVYDEGPWNIVGNMLSLQQWVPELSIFEVKFNLIAFWIQIQGLPLDLFSTANASKIAGQIGDPIEVEDPKVEGKFLRPFIRVKVFVDTSKPLATSFWVPRRDLPKAWVFLKYEKLQGFCFKCGVLGHEQKGCSVPRAMAAYNSSVPRYTQSLGVSTTRSLASIAGKRNSQVIRNLPLKALQALRGTQHIRQMQS